MYLKMRNLVVPVTASCMFCAAKTPTAEVSAGPAIDHETQNTNLQKCSSRRTRYLFYGFLCPSNRGSGSKVVVVRSGPEAASQPRVPATAIDIGSTSTMTSCPLASRAYTYTTSPCGSNTTPQLAFIGSLEPVAVCAVSPPLKRYSRSFKSIPHPPSHFRTRTYHRPVVLGCSENVKRSARRRKRATARDEVKESKEKFADCARTWHVPRALHSSLQNENDLGSTAGMLTKSNHRHKPSARPPQRPRPPIVL